MRFHKIDRTVLVVIASFFVLVGCDIFDTRDAEIPGTGGTPWVPPTLPAQVFINLESGLEDLTGANYEKSLADVFTFVPLAADVDKLGADVYKDWTKTVEVGVTDVLLNDSRTVAVEFIKTQIRDEADFADFRVTYQLVVTYTRGATETFKGVARLDLQRVGGNWQLIRWEDQEGVEGFATWGYLRGVTRNPNTQ